MAKEIQSRLPRPQATLSNTYFAPNMPSPVRPQAPVQPVLAQFVAGDTANELTAMGRLNDAFLNFGQKLQKAEYIKIGSEEEIRIAQMTTEQVRQELKERAKEAESSGLLSYGSNPYRKMVATEYLAERVMRDEYMPTLTANLSRFSNPMNEEDAKVFARDTFEGLGINSYFGQRAATNLYNSMSSNWLSQVDSQRGSRMVKKNRDDLRDASYHVFRNYAAGEINYADAVALIDEKSNTFYDLEGDAGRDWIVAGLDTAVRNQALEAEDEDDVERLQHLIEEIRTTKTGGLALNKDHLDTLDELENYLNQAHKRLGDVAESEIDNDIQVIEDAISAEVNRLKDQGVVPNQEEVWKAAVAAVGGGVHKRALDRVEATKLDDYFIAYHSKQNRTSKPELEELANRIEEASADPSQVDRLIDSADVSWDERRQLRQIAQQQRTINQQALRDSYVFATGPLKGAEAAADALNPSISNNLDPIDGSLLHTMRAASPRTVGDKAVKDVIARGGTQDEMNQAMHEAASAVNQAWVAVTKDEGRYFDLELAREYASQYPDVFTPEVLTTMERMTEGQAAQALGIRGLEPDTPGPDIELQEGWAWRRAMIDNIDDVRELHTSSPSPERDSQIDTYNQETRKDALNYRKSVRASALEILTVTGRPTDEASIRKAINQLVPNNPEDYVQSQRLGGVSPKNLREGVDDMGVPLSINPDFDNPYMTLMVNPDTFIDDLTALSAVESGLSLEQLREALPNNGIIEGYLAYRDMVGVNDAVSFDEGKGTNFLSMTLKGIGLYTLPVVSDDLRKALSSE